MHLPVLFFLLLCRVEVMLSDEDFRESDPEDRELFVENVLKEVSGRRYCGFTSLRLPKLHISIRKGMEGTDDVWHCFLPSMGMLKMLQSDAAFVDGYVR